MCSLCPFSGIKIFAYRCNTFAESKIKSISLYDFKCSRPYVICWIDYGTIDHRSINFTDQCFHPQRLGKQRINSNIYSDFGSRIDYKTRNWTGFINIKILLCSSTRKKSCSSNRLIDNICSFILEKDSKLWTR